MNRLARLAQRHPWRVIAAWVVLIVSLAPLALHLEDRLKAGGFEDPDGDSQQTARTLERAFGDPANFLQVVVRTDEGTPADVRDGVREAASTAGSTEHVTAVTTWRDDPALTADDGLTSMVLVGLDSDSTTTQNLVAPLRDDLASTSPESVEVDVTGAAALDYDLNVQSKADATRAELIAFPLLFLVLLLIFRSVVAMAVPLVLAGMTLVVTQGIGHVLTRFTDLSILFTNGVSLIGLAVAVDYSLFIVKRHREELEGSGSGAEAALATSMATAGHAVLFSGLAVVVALSSLLIPGLMVFTSIGLAGVVVTVVALAMSMSLLPAVLTVLGPRIDWGRLPRRRTGSAVVATSEASNRPRPGGRWRPVAVLLVLTAAFVAMAWPATGARLEVPVASADILPADADSRQGVEALRSSIGTASLFPIQAVVSGADPDAVTQAAAQFARSAQEVGGVERVALDPRTATDPDTGDAVARVALSTTLDPDSDGAHRLVEDLRSELAADGTPGVQATLGGATAGGADFDRVVVDSIPAILGAVVLATLALLGWAFRSWRLPVLALVLNGLVVGASLGLLTLYSRRVLDEDINSVTPVLLFAIMFGLSMDYLVIMISRMREHFAAGADHEAAIGRGLRQTAGLVNGAAVVMVAVFASFMSAEISIVRQLGLGLALAVVLDAVVVRMVLMPAALHVLGPRVWGRAARPATPTSSATVDPLDPELSGAR